MIPTFAYVGKGRDCDLQMHCTPLASVSEFDCVVIVTDHSDYDYARIAKEAKLIVDTRNAMKGIDSPNTVRC